MNYIQIAIVVVAFASGLVIIVKRAQISMWQKNFQASRGGREAQKAADSTSPFSILLAGMAGVFIGTLIAIEAIVRREG